MRTKQKATSGRYLNLKFEMQREGVTQKTAAKHLGMTENNLNMKINGRVPFTVPEVTDLRDTFMPDATLDYLLAIEQPTHAEPAIGGE